MFKGKRNQFKDSRSSHWLDKLTKERVFEVYDFHKSMPAYETTSLADLKKLAAELKLNKLYVKDESSRFGLNAFKGLGASYAMAEHFASKLGKDLTDLPFEKLLKTIGSLPKITFTTATDGNHGKAVAWAAQLFQQQAVIYMPKNTAQARIEAVKAYGAEVIVSSVNYDATVKNADQAAKENKWVLIQDTAWEDYEDIPWLIMEGYTTIVKEIYEELGSKEFSDLTHIILQAGVGSFPASIVSAVITMFEHLNKSNRPQFIIVEPGGADPFYQSVSDEEGKAKTVEGDLNTIMAGLACGKPSPIAWDILKAQGDYFFSCDDYLSKQGMHLFATPLADDPVVVAGESGALPLGFLSYLMTRHELKDLQAEMGLDFNSKVLVINTEGATDPEHYQQVLEEMEQK